MLFFQDEKDKLRQELDTIIRKIGELKGMQDFQKHRIDKLEEGITVVMNSYPHGARKDGTPRAKPGRKPKAG